MISSYPLFIGGLLIAVIIAFDFFYTTVSFNGSGFINRMAAVLLSSLFLNFQKQFKNRNILKFSGLSQVLCSIFLWIGLLWLGFFLMLMSSNYAVVHAGSHLPAGPINKFYFSGYVLSTLGNGEFLPGNEFWQVIVAVFSFSGFIFITTAITYLLNLNSAVLHKRSLALYISNLGDTPEEIAINNYSGGSFERLIKYAPELQAKINRHNQNHYAYPISHYFYSSNREESLIVNLANLSEALTIIRFHIDKKSTVDEDMHALHDSIHEFLSTAQQSFATKSKDYDEVPINEERLSDLGIPLIDVSFDEEEKKAVEKRRSIFSNLLESSGWSWNDLYDKGN